MSMEKARRSLVQALSSKGFIKSRRVADAMLTVPRECFIPDSELDYVYEDRPLPIGFGQTISAPHMVAIMTELLDLLEDSSVLEIGGGSGYQAAVISQIASKGMIYSIERIPGLADYERKNLDKCGYSNVKVILGDGSRGYQGHAPYDRIIVTAAAPKVPSRLVEQLEVGGILLAPVGNRFLQDLVVVRKLKDETINESHGGCVFVPLIGEGGWEK